ncbi:hypothetical protein N7499_007953 [Penicillium canescens]|uniref:Uncharacterized protein n=1 Tax=Penicillium canescens TaxID=5083 RepID=A0AAD6HY45_PENCN|nr:uncharacterized protein N7446_012989 [Penicillium canescens]KAJ5985755.1 hypothetical protein N7522_012951 [Penicillium canescens]KAJ6022638.1 hypothetical protein N7460_013033 [Penicillium canescens]KAJ6026100.1 hypothetical protein N7444_013779 [Penicillium canescens]KAJ6041923.1 hypothetical protein N7446_012989 [Penicillium canescens]KAJ6075972.1 hypothetical protein N7499_007953 [Penicillium canescens]
MHKFLAALLFAASALATPAPDTTATAESIGTETNSDADSAASAAAAALIAEIPSSVLTVMETAIPYSWQAEILTNPTFRSSVVSAAEAGTFPAWFNDLPNSVKAWATSNFDAQIIGVPATTQDTVSETSSSVMVTSQTASNAAQTTLPDSSSATTSSSGSGSSSGSSSASASPSSSKSTGGAPAPSGGVAMGVAGAAGVFVLALAL